jgi:hypothetical protein
MMLASLVVALFIAFLSAMDDDFAVFLLLPVLCFVVGFGRVLHGVFLAERRAPRIKGAAAQPHFVPTLSAQPAHAARSPELSPQRVAPIQSFTARRGKTAEMVQPPSVTENTTRLLDEEADAQQG